MDVLELLAASREYAEDPNHIVCDPRHVYEGERGCIAGIVGLVGCDDGTSVTAIDAALDATGDAAMALYGGYTSAMLAGQEAMLKVYDRAINAEAVKVTADPAHVYTTAA